MSSSSHQKTFIEMLNNYHIVPDLTSGFLMHYRSYKVLFHKIVSLYHEEHPNCKSTNLGLLHELHINRHLRGRRPTEVTRGHSRGDYCSGKSETSCENHGVEAVGIIQPSDHGKLDVRCVCSSIRLQKFLQMFHSHVSDFTF